MASIEVRGAGIVGLWQANMLADRGHKITLTDPAGIPSAKAASRLAGAMLAPFCEDEPGHRLCRELGLEAIDLWRKLYPPLLEAGTLVVAAPRDRADLSRFSAITEGHRRIDAAELENLEPALAGRFREALFYEREAHVDPIACLNYLADRASKEGVVFACEGTAPKGGDWVVDCRGMAAIEQLKTLRGVRGERVVLDCPGVSLKRPVRLLHPRVPFYIVPWSGDRFMVGATVIESDDDGAPTLRSVAELLSLAYALLPELGEARIIDIDAGVRPSFPDNEPKIIVRDRTLFVNGMYRNGFLLAPILAEAAAAYIEDGTARDGVVFEDHGQW
jgi:glycine oxidase